MLGFDELAKDSGNGIILGVAGGNDDIFNSGWCGRGHILSEGRGDTVFWDVEVSHMHFQSGVQSFELLQCLVSEDIILIDPLVL